MAVSEKAADKKFRDEQKKLAKEQNLHADNAVPEQRPIASQQPSSDLESELHKRKAAKGDYGPMPKSAYDKADKKPSGSGEQLETLKVGDKVRVVDTQHEFYGDAGAVTKVTYSDEEEAQTGASRDASKARFAKVSDILIRTRGGAHALVSLKPEQVKTINTLGVGSSTN